MKRTITTFALAAALLLTAGVGTSFARSTNKAGDNVNAYFDKDFRQAELLDTKTGPDYPERLLFQYRGTAGRYT